MTAPWRALEVTAVVWIAWSVPSRAVAAPSCDLRGTAIVAAADVQRREDELRAAVLEKTAKDADRKQALADLEARLAQEPAAVNDVVVDGRVRISVALANPPASRLRVSFDAVDGGHHELDWDPAVSAELAKVVWLDGPVGGAATRTWHVTASVEASTYTQSAGTVIVQTQFESFPAPAAAPATTATMVGRYHAFVAALGPGGSAIPRSQELTGWSAPILSFACNPGLATIDDARFTAPSGATPAGALRGFGVAPTFVTDTLSLLTEIAVDRAKAGAMRMLQKRLVDPFCRHETRISLARLGFGTSDALALPRTCEVLTSLRLEDILSSGRPLLYALRDDLRFTIAPAAIAELTAGNTTANSVLGIGLGILNTAIDHGGFDGLEGQLALDLLGNLKDLAPRLPVEVSDALAAAVTAAVAKAADPIVLALAPAVGVSCATAAACEPLIGAELQRRLRAPIGEWTLPSAAALGFVQTELVNALHASAVARPPLELACQARLVVAVVKRCTQDGCSAADIDAMLSEPDDHFAVEPELPAALCWAGPRYLAPSGDVARVAELVLEGLRLVAPLADGRGRDRARGAIRLIVELVERWGVAGGTKRCDCLQTFSEVAFALIEDDYGTALGRLVLLAEQLQPTRVPPALSKLAKLIGAVATYASVYQATKDDNPEAARTARKEALSSIIDSATDRSNRENEWVFSIGSNVGISATWIDQYGTRDGDDSFDPGLRVPLGFAVDWLPGKHRQIGLHVGAQLADLGQFVRRGDDKELDDVRWADFVSPGLELSVLLGFLDPALNVSVHAAYAPSLEFDDTDGVWRYGVSLGYYVPFFDLN